MLQPEANLADRDALMHGEAVSRRRSSSCRRAARVFAPYFVVGAAIYSNVALHAAFSLDAPEYVTNNPVTRDLTRSTAPSFARVNVLIHGITAFLVFFLFRTTAAAAEGRGGPAPSAESGLLPSLLAGLIFLVHPFQTQVVPYVTQRFTCLSGLLCVGCVLAYTTFRARIDVEDVRQVHPAFPGAAPTRRFCFRNP